MSDTNNATGPKTGPGPLELLADAEWKTLLEKDDRTSPSEYPEMALITRNELSAVICEGYLLAKDQNAKSVRAEITRLFKEAQAEVPVDNNLSRWATLADMQDRLAGHGLCAKSDTPPPKLAVAGSRTVSAGDAAKDAEIVRLREALTEYAVAEYNQGTRKCRLCQAEAWNRNGDAPIDHRPDCILVNLKQESAANG